MPRFRRTGPTRHRKDGNHDEIKDLFMDRGFSWVDIHGLGGGVGDGIAGGYGENVLIEVKPDTGDPVKMLTDGESKFRKAWRGWHEIVQNEADVDRVCAEAIRRGVRSI